MNNTNNKDCIKETVLYRIIRLINSVICKVNIVYRLLAERKDNIMFI